MNPTDALMNEIIDSYVKYIETQIFIKETLIETDDFLHTFGPKANEGVLKSISNDKVLIERIKQMKITMNEHLKNQRNPFVSVSLN
jgi:hypothetical protein